MVTVITVTSDTHGYHSDLKLPGGDILLHCGDNGSHGSYKHARHFINWVAKQNYKHKVIIAGNHDLCFDDPAYKDVLLQHMENKGVIYLEDSGVDIDGIKIWGSPITPQFGYWAFMRHRGVDISEHWNMIPSDTNILLTHGPPMDMLDETISNGNQGCGDLRDKVLKLPVLRYHCFGHIHEDFGILTEQGVTYMNASYCKIPLSRYYTNYPVTFEYDSGTIYSDY